MRTNRNRIVFDGDLVYRFPVHHEDQLLIEVHAQQQQRAHDLGLPVPQVFAVETGDSQPYIVMPRVPGTPLMETDLDDSALARLAGDLAGFLASLWSLQTWTPSNVQWPALWQALATAAPSPETTRAAELAESAPSHPAHGDLSPGNLMVDGTGRLTGVIDWDAATMSDPATDWSALCANTGPVVAEHLRAAVRGSEDLDERADAYLATWEVQNDLWQQDRHPWLLGHRPLSEPRI